MIEALSHLFDAVCGQNPGHTWMPGGLLLPCCQRCTGLYVGAGLAALLHLWLRPKLNARFLRIHGAFLVFMAPFGFHWVVHGSVMRTITGVLFGFAVVTFLWLPVVEAFRARIRTRASTTTGRQKTSNIQHPTSNIQWQPVRHSLDVGRSMLDVGCFTDAWRGTGEGVPTLVTSGGGPRGAGETPAVPSPDSAACAYFFVLAAALAFLPMAARMGGLLAAYILSTLSFWGAICFGVLIVADAGLALVAALRWFFRVVFLGVLA